MPKITLKNLPAMGDKGIYYNEGFASRYINGVRVLTPTYLLSGGVNNTTTGFTNLAQITGMDSMLLNSDTTLSALIAIQTDGKLFHYGFLSADTAGEMHTATNPSSFGDIFVTKNENLLYATQDRLGVGYRGVCKAGSSTTKIVDTDGRNFTTLGISSSAGHNKVYNIQNKEVYTVTSVSTTDATNDTLNFSAGTANVAGQYFIAFNDEGYGTDFDFFNSTTYPQYKAQKPKASIIRQIRAFDTDYLVLNGNFLASLSVDESTFNSNHKQLPTNTEGTCFAVNQAQIAVGGSYKGKGRLMLWDGFSDGWLSIIELERIPQAIEAYNGGFLVMVGCDLFFTNGYQMQLITTLPDSDFYGATNTVLANGMKVIGDRVYINATLARLNRAKTGTWIYDMKAGWTLVPSRNSLGDCLSGQTMGAIKSVVANGTNRLFVNYTGVTGTQTSFITLLSDASNPIVRPSMMFFAEIGQEVNVKQVKLSLGVKNDYNGNSTAAVSVAVGDARQQMFRSFTLGLTNSTTLIKNVSAANAGQEGVVGQQVRILKGASAGQRTYIQSIANPGTANEELTCAPALSAAPTDSMNANLNDLRYCGSKTVTALKLQEYGQLSYDVSGVLSDKIFVEVYITGSDSGFIDIHSVEVSF